MDWAPLALSSGVKSVSTFPKPRLIVYTIKAFLPLYCYLALWTIHITLSPFQQVAVVYWKESRQAVERNLVDIPTTSGKFCPSVQFSSVQSLSHVRLFATPWTAALQASLSITNSWSLLKLMSIESVMSFNYLILCRPLLLSPSIFPSIRVFSNESAFTSGGQSIGASASASVLPMNILG